MSFHAKLGIFYILHPFYKHTLHEDRPNPMFFRISRSGNSYSYLYSHHIECDSMPLKSLLSVQLLYNDVF